MKRNYPLLLNLGLLLVLALAFGPAQSQNIQENTKITKSYEVNSGVTVEMANKYGKVHVATWDKDSVKVVINTTIRAKNEEKLLKLKEGIDFEFTHTSHHVTLKTLVGRVNLLGDLGDAITPNENSVAIDCSIIMPQSGHLVLSNKFGDVYCEKLTQEAEITISHGDLKATSFTAPSNSINVSFGDARINYIKGGRMNFRYSDVRIKNAEKLDIDSKSSTITLHAVNSLKSVSRKDKYFIRKIDRITISSNFSEYQLENLSKEAIATMKFGEFNLESVSSSVRFLDLTSNYTDMDLNLDPDATFDFYLSQRNGEFDYPETNSKLVAKRLETDDKTVITSGNIGQGSGSSSKIKIQAEGGEIKLYHH